MGDATLREAMERAIAALTVPSGRLGSVPLENIADLTPGTSPAEIERLNRQRQVTVYAGLLPGVSQTPAMDAMTRAAPSFSAAIASTPEPQP